MKLNSLIAGALLVAPWPAAVSFVPAHSTAFARNQLALRYKDQPGMRNEDMQSVSKQSKELKKQIEQEHTQKVSEEEKLGVTVQGKDKIVPAKKMISFQDEKLQKRIERLLQPKPYPRFVLEKFANLVGNAIPTMGQAKPPTQKERIVLLGSGWGAASFLKNIDTNKFDVTVISPRNYFLFTPMLAGSSVGTLEYRSITMPIRSINPDVKYLEATATDLDAESQQVSCISVQCDKVACEITDFDVPYDRLVVTVGAQISTFGVPGVKENCFFLKEVNDARQIRKSIVNCFERASLPGLTEQEQKDILTFAIIGAGPTGVEFAGELRDFVEEDGPKYYPDLLRHVKIKIFEYTDVVLRPFEKSLQEAAVESLTRETRLRDKTAQEILPENYKMVDLRLECGVNEVKEDRLVLTDGKEEKFGMCLWAAGNGPQPITLKIIDAIGGAQTGTQDVARGRIAIDPWLRALGGNGKIFALGDCTCSSCSVMSRQLPATAQVAGQQAEYLADIFNRRVNMTARNKDDNKMLPPIKPKPDKPSADSIATQDLDKLEFAAPFQFLNLGILAYVGGKDALAQVQVGEAKGKIKGSLGYGVWQSVYLTKQTSWKNRVFVTLDWFKSKIFGRDISTLE